MNQTDNLESKELIADIEKQLESTRATIQIYQQANNGFINDDVKKVV